LGNQGKGTTFECPGKVLREINGIPLIEYHIERVKTSQLIDRHIIAISDTSADAPLRDYLRLKKQSFFAGSEHDVLGRFYKAALNAGAKDDDTIVRLTADCPLICSSQLDEVIEAHVRCPQKQYAHLSLEYFPRGFDAEVFSMADLKSAFENALTDYDREHVTPYLYNSEAVGKITIKTGHRSWSSYRLCVDEADDFDLIVKILEHLGQRWLNATAQDICSLMEQFPALTKINNNVIQHLKN